MKTVLAFRHVGFEDLGAFGPALVRRGYAIHYVDIGVEPIRMEAVENADLMIVLGGPIGAYDDAHYPFIAGEMAAISRRLALRRPLLGICLGAQMMARALGAPVISMGVKEIGYAPLTLSAAGAASALGVLALPNLPEGTIPVLHWHGDRFDIPADAVGLASTPTCENQAFAYEDFALGLQFHLEADPTRLEQWLIGHNAELMAAGIAPAVLRRQAAQYGSALIERIEPFLHAWLK